MSKLIDQAVQHFSNLETRSVKIPEWSEEEFYAKNLTLADMAKLATRAQDDTYDYMCFVIIFGLTDGEGSCVFDIGDKAKLKNHTSKSVTERIASQILEAQTMTEEDRLKN